MASCEYITAESDGERCIDELLNRCLKSVPELKNKAKNKVGRPKKSTRSTTKLLDPELPCPNVDHRSANSVGVSRKKSKLNFSEGIRDVMEDVSTNLKDDLVRMSSKLDRIFNVLNELMKRVDALEQKDEEYAQRFSHQEKRINELEARLEESDRKATLNKAILTFEKIDSASNNLEADVSKFLSVNMKLTPSVMNGLLISRFGRGGHTVLLEFSSVEARRQIFRARKNLINMDEGRRYETLYVNDFLTRNKVEILKKAREMKREGRIHAFSVLI
jgi:myosin heavy subunit